MPYALLSVYDKTGLMPLVEGLRQQGFQFIASGSTAAFLREHQLSVIDVADYTQSPEMLGGRVKTLHPAIHAGLLARETPEDQTELKHRGWHYIDLVVVNLYPFEETISKPNTSLAEAIEQIDIGGVALIRAAAKNYERVTLVCDPADYNIILDNNSYKNLDIRKKLAIKGFKSTCQYDANIFEYLENPKKTKNLKLYPIQTLRYGENPHQSAILYSEDSDSGPLGGTLLQGKPLSYNNLLDIDAALRAVQLLTKPAVCIIKHVSPCGMACAENLTDAFQAALACDAVSAFGGIIAANKIIDENFAHQLGNLFIECLIASGFTSGAREILAKRTQCRLLQIDAREFSVIAQAEWRTIHRGFLYQPRDYGDPADIKWTVVTHTQPTEAQWLSLHFAWHVCQHVKSNAIVFVQQEASVGIGGGQPNRIDCVRMAARRAGEKAKGAVMASDAFFPFADGIEEAIQHGISAVIQPGGSIRDAEVIQAANQAGIAMVFTGIRHFRH